MELDIIVCIKSVIMQTWGQQAARTLQSCELNPFDRPALEQALILREKFGGSVSALSMGPACCESALREALAMGADRGILICDPALAGSDTLVTATVLAAAIRKLAPFDLVLFGTRSADSDTGQVGPQTAVALDLPLVAWTRAITPAEDGLRIERCADGFLERFQVALPTVLTIHPDALQPRDVELWGLESAFAEQTVEHMGLFDLGFSPEQVGEAGSPTRVVSMAPIQRDRKCKFLPGSAEEQVEALIQRLSETGLLA